MLTTPACVITIVLCALLTTAPALGGDNLLRNGSFEGHHKYWLANGPGFANEPLSEGLSIKQVSDAPYGQSVLVMRGSSVRSVPFVIEPGKTITVSVDARADVDGTDLMLNVSPTLDDRQNGTPPFGSRGKNTGFRATIGRQWQRVHWTIDIPGPRWKWSGPGASFNWDAKSWIVMLRAPKGREIQIDGVRVVVGNGTDVARFAPASAVECLLTSPEVTNANYQARANIFDADQSVPLRLFLNNPLERAQTVVVRWQLLGYDGAITFSETTTAPIRLNAGQTQTIDHSVSLKGRGLMLARATILDPSGQMISRSDQPLTNLAFPKQRTKPDLRERIGGTVVNGRARVPAFEDVAQRIGYGWSRWYPNTEWRRVQPDGPDQYKWPDDIIEGLQSRGIAINAVWYGLPEWARSEKSKYIPKDMADWHADDPRWDDLSIETLWDKYLIESMKRYGREGMVWELVNEPEFSGGTLLGGGETGAAGARRWDARFYVNFVRRSYKRIKSIDPRTIVLISGVNNGVDPITREFLKLGGAPYCDVYSYHDYNPGGLNPESIRNMYSAFREAGAHEKFEVWFNEGWSNFPSSEDWPANLLHADRGGPEVADMIVRSVSDSFAAGLEKLIMFNTAYPTKGKSLWDWSGDGTGWYDDTDSPTVAVGMFNVLIDQLGLSRHVATIDAPTHRIQVFDDLRNGRGVAVVWTHAPRAGQSPARKPWQVSTEPGGVVDVPLRDLQVMDVMGNVVSFPAARDGHTRLVFPRAGKPLYVFSPKLTPDALAEAMRRAQHAPNP